MKRAVIIFIILLFNLVFQSTVLQYFRINSVIPNTALAVIISIALLRGRLEGCLTGFAAGILQDIFFGNSLGYYALFGVLSGYIAGRFNHNYYRENYALPVFLCFTGTLIYESAVFFTSAFFDGYLNYFYFLINIILPEAVYTAVVAIVIYRLLFSINDRIEKSEKYKRKLFSIK